MGNSTQKSTQYTCSDKKILELDIPFDYVLVIIEYNDYTKIWLSLTLVTNISICNIMAKDS